MRKSEAKESMDGETRKQILLINVLFTLGAILFLSLMLLTFVFLVEGHWILSLSSMAGAFLFGVSSAGFMAWAAVKSAENERIAKKKRRPAGQR